MFSRHEEERRGYAMSASASPGAEKGSMASEKNPPEHFDGGHYTNPDTIR